MGCLLLTVILIISLISPITKYLIEKYDVKYTGRQITTDWIYVNPFTGYIHFSNLKIYESSDPFSLTWGDSVFFSANGISANIALLKLLSGTIEIKKLTIDEPKEPLYKAARILISMT